MYSHRHIVAGEPYQVLLHRLDTSRFLMLPSLCSTWEELLTQFPSTVHLRLSCMRWT